MPTPEQVRSTIDAYVERFSAGDRDGWVALFTDDAHQEDPVGSPPNVGHDAIGAFYDAMLALGGPQLSLAREPVVVGDEALMFLVARTGEGAGRLRVPFIVDHLVLDDDGRIRSLRAFWDPTSMEPDPET